MKFSLSLKEMADRALEAQKTGTIHADLALRGEEIGSAGLVAMKQKALAGDEQYAEMLGYLDEANEAIFVDAFARASYFRGIIAKLAMEEHPDPDKVLATFVSARSNRMYVRGQKEPQPAIPIFTSFENRADALKQYRSPFLTPASNRGRNGKGVDHIHSAGHQYIVPTTTLDHECFEQMSGLLRRMPEVMLNWLKASKKEDVRRAVWLALHFFPGTYVLRGADVEAKFQCRRGIYKSGDGRVTYLLFRLTQSEFFMIPDSVEAQQLMKLLHAHRKE